MRTAISRGLMFLLLWLVLMPSLVSAALTAASARRSESGGATALLIR